MIKGIRINKSKIVHLYCEGADRTDCGAGGMGDALANGGTPTDDAVTCKRCLKTVASQVERAHAEAVGDDEARSIYRASNNVDSKAVVIVAVEQARTEAIEENGARDAARRSRETADAITAYQIKRAENMDRVREEDHAEAIEENRGRHGVHLDMWRGADGRQRTCDVVVPAGSILRSGRHEGPCFDSLREEWREEPTPSRRQRKAARRDQRATLRRQAPQMRAAARARRTRRGEARATAKALLVAVGVPQDVANRYASSFSRGTQVRTASERIRLGNRNSKRVEVKRYTWPQFVERLTQYRPDNHQAYLCFERAAAQVRKLVMA